ERWLVESLPAKQRRSGALAVSCGVGDEDDAARSSGTSACSRDVEHSDFAIRGGKSSADLQGGFEAIYARENDSLAGMGRETFEAVNFLKKANPEQYQPENGAVYPRNPFGNSLLQIAQLIKAGVGLEVAFTDIGGWDTHVNEGNSRGQLGNLLQQFSAAIAALYQDLGQRMDDVIILTMSEFGRTVRENGNRGTDHGHANAMFVIGNSV